MAESQSEVGSSCDRPDGSDQLEQEERHVRVHPTTIATTTMVTNTAGTTAKTEPTVFSCEDQCVDLHKLSNEYTRYEPNRLIEFKIAGTMSARASYVVEPAGTGRARLTSRIEMRAPGPFRVAEPLMAARLRKDVESNLRNLKDLLEASAEERPVPGGVPD